MGNRIKRSPISISPLDWNGSSHYGPDWVDPHRFDYYGGYNPNVDNDMAQRDLALGTISAAAGVVNPVLGAAVNLGTQAISNAMTENAQDRYMQKWGSPQAQMRNMAAAGINPYLAAGNITGNSGNSQISTQPTAINPADLDNAVMNPQQAEALEAQIGKGKAEAENLAADTMQKEQMLSGLVEQLSLDNRIKRMYAGKYSQLLGFDLLKAEFETMSIQAQMDLWEMEEREKAANIELMGSEQGKLAAEKIETMLRANRLSFFLQQLKKNGINLDSPEGQYNYAKNVLGNEQLANDILDASYQIEWASHLAQFNVNPVNHQLNTQYDYVNYLKGLLEESDQTLRDIDKVIQQAKIDNEKWKNGEISGSELFYEENGQQYRRRRAPYDINGLQVLRKSYEANRNQLEQMYNSAESDWDQMQKDYRLKRSTLDKIEQVSTIVYNGTRSVTEITTGFLNTAEGVQKISRIGRKQ